MCGIFGWAGKDPKQFDKTKLDILGIFNEVRGVHSCGIATDGEIAIGIDGNKIYRDFLSNVGYNTPVYTPIVIGHTRQSTYGAHTIENAHPFGFGELNGNYEFVGVHNGTLLNHKEIASQFNISDTALVKKTPTMSSHRSKIDSEIILETLYKTKNFKVLSVYNGAAALVWTDLNNPNVLYCYHGESRKRDFVNSPVEEERPLFYYQEKKNSVYISSLSGSLKAIGATDGTLFAFKTNTIYKITDGDVSKAEKTTISRLTNFQTGEAYESKKGTSTTPNEKGSLNTNEGTNRSHSNYRPRVGGLEKNPDKLYFNLYTEAPAQNVNVYQSKIYMNKLRYHRNGHLVTGCFMYIPNYGFKFLAEGIPASEKRFYDFVNKYFVDGEFKSADDLSTEEKKTAIIPFIHSKGDEIINPPLYYMYEGVRIKTSFDYIACLDMDRKKSTPFNYEQLSHCSAHPILDIKTGFKGFDFQNILLEGVPVTDTICPLGSEKVYEIVNGNCVKSTLIKDYPAQKSTTPKDAQTTLALVTKNLIEIEKTFQEDDKLVTHHVEDDLLEEDLNDMFKDALRKFPSYIARLKEYNDPKATRASLIMEVLLKKVTKILIKDTKE